jgi:hypothetical protein
MYRVICGNTIATFFNAEKALKYASATKGVIELLNKKRS